MAVTTAKVLFINFVVHYGFPAKLHSGQGKKFESTVIKELCHIEGIGKSRTTQYHPMVNGMIKQFSQTLLIFGTLQEDQKSNWKSFVPTLVHAYNSTYHDSTGFTPFYLMFGRHPRLAVDGYLGLGPEETQTQTEYAKKLQSRLDFAYKAAFREAQKNSGRYKLNYDMHVRESKLEAGDRVIVCLVGLKGKHKLADKWEREPYVVLVQPSSGIPVYWV